MTSRNDLNEVFKAETLASFQFLESEFNFVPTLVTPQTVRYESARVFVRVDFSYGYEVEVSVGRLQARSIAHGLRWVAAAVGKTAEPLLQASTVDRLRDILRRSAELLRETGTQVLSGDENAFNAVARLQRQDADRVTREQLSKQARRGLEKAWSTGDFASVVEILEEMPALGPLDKERLQYARKHSDRHKM